MQYHIEIAQKILVDVDPEIAPDEEPGLRVQLAQAYALVAIAQILERFVDDAEGDRQRRDMIALYSIEAAP